MSCNTFTQQLPLAAPPTCPPFTPPLSRHLAPTDCCIASCCAALSSSCCAALLSSHCPLTALPSSWQAGCCVTSCHTALLSYSHRAALLLSCSGWLSHCLSLRRPLVFLPCRHFVLLLRAGWLLCGLHQTKLPPLNAPTTTATAAATAIAAVTAAAATVATATTVVELSIVHCLRKRQQQHHHQCTNVAPM